MYVFAGREFQTEGMSTQSLKNNKEVTVVGVETVSGTGIKKLVTVVGGGQVMHFWVPPAQKVIRIDDCRGHWVSRVWSNISVRQ